MEPEERKDEALSQEEPAPTTPEEKPYKPYSRKARMYAYAFASVSILKY